MLEPDWLLTVLIYGLIGCSRVGTVRLDPSDYKHLRLNRELNNKRFSQRSTQKSNKRPPKRQSDALTIELEEVVPGS